jgi:prephenate dehydrogenase
MSVTSTNLGDVTVIGCGLIGGSLVKGLRRGGGASAVSAVDKAEVLEIAAPHLDDSAEPGSAKAASLIAKADLVVLAMPIGAIITSLGSVLAGVRQGTVVTDTGSVKKPVVAAARSHARASSFVGGHPMAGREVGGFEASSADLFEGARWFIVEDRAGGAPSPDRTNHDRVASLATALGAEPVLIDAETHDRAMAYVSHAPQLIASAVYSAAARAGFIGEAGPGFRDVTRISGAPVSTWRDIFETNRVELASALGEILEPLVELRRRLAEGDPAAVRSALALLEEVQAAKARRQADRRSKGERLA